MPPEFGRKWGTECLTRLPLPILLCAGYIKREADFMCPVSISFNTIEVYVVIIKNRSKNLGTIFCYKIIFSFSLFDKGENGNVILSILNKV